VLSQPHPRNHPRRCDRRGMRRSGPPAAVDHASAPVPVDGGGRDHQVSGPL